MISIVAPFRKFDSIADAFDQHGRLLATSRYYEKARQYADRPESYAPALTGIYASDDKYGKKLVAQMRQYDLYQYDR